jgi:hypothetical protein
LHPYSKGQRNEYVTLDYMECHILSLNIRVLILNSNIFFRANFGREKLIWQELDLSGCKLLIEQERDE